MCLAENFIDRPFGKGMGQSRAAAFKGLRLESPLHHIWLRGVDACSAQGTKCHPDPEAIFICCALV